MTSLMDKPTVVARAEDSPTWAKGYDPVDLKLITSLFKAHDLGHVHGPFDRYSEQTLAEDLSKGTVYIGDRDEDGVPFWAMVARVTDRSTPVRDFAGGRMSLPNGTLFCSRMAFASGNAAVEILARLWTHQGAVAVEAWQEHAGERALLDRLRAHNGEGLRGGRMRLGAVKIKASSAMRGVWVSEEITQVIAPYPAHEALGLGRLPFTLPQGKLLSLAANPLVIDPQAFAQHYSGYNKGGSWSAVALRGFYDDPLRIEKPAEMNRKWKAENDADLALEVRDTPLRAQLPAVEKVLAAIPCAGLERVRLMRLEPGGGELMRHADITDPDAGASPGKLVRVHIPLVSNPDVVFHSWDLDGLSHRLVMEPGAAYYLDTRKPHTALNGGSTARVHLVADCWANEQTVEALAASEEAPHASE